MSTKVGRLLVPTDGDVDGAEGFYGTPPLTRIRDYSRDGVLRSLEDSLRRLGLDRVDIALIHNPDDYLSQAADDAYPALAELRSQGVVTAIGAGMNSAAPLTWLVERCWPAPAGWARLAPGTASRWPRRRCASPCATRRSRPPW